MSQFLNLVMLPVFLMGPGDAGVAARDTGADVLIRHVYPISDLIDCGFEEQAAVADRATELLDTITQMVAPESWAANGGAGKIAYFSNGGQMVILQRRAVQDEIHQFLERLRENLPLHVSYEIVVMKMPQETYLQVERGVRGKGQATLLDHRKWVGFLEAVQNEESSTLLRTPTLTARSGVAREVDVLDGSLKIKGVVSVDRRYIDLFVKNDRSDASLSRFETNRLQADGSALLISGGKLGGPESHQVLVLGIQATIVVPEEEEERIGAL